MHMVVQNSFQVTSCVFSPSLGALTELHFCVYVMLFPSFVAVRVRIASNLRPIPTTCPCITSSPCAELLFRSSTSNNNNNTQPKAFLKPDTVHRDGKVLPCNGLPASPHSAPRSLTCNPTTVLSRALLRVTFP
jgi:hypothetical protein